MTTEDENSEEYMQAIKDCFALFDKNGDGWIDADELQAGFESFGQKRRRSSIVRMMDDAVVNDEQQKMMDLEEFAFLIKAANMDGTIERAMAKKRNPKDVDMVKEENDLKKRFGRPRLSRDDLSASVYGNLTASTTTEESPEYLQTKLEEFEQELTKMDDQEKKDYHKAQANGRVDDKHKAMFLRAELFDAKLAAHRCCSHWTFVVEIFGEDKAFLPMTLDGALKDDNATEEVLGMPIFHDTGAKDNYGQVLFLLDLESFKTSKLDDNALTRAVFYVVQSRMEADEDAQRRGVVLQILPARSPKMWNMRFTKNMLSWMRTGAPVRIACIQVFHTTPGLFNVMFHIMRTLAGELACRMKIFGDGGKSNNDALLLAKLQSFGVDKSQLVTQLGGDLVLPDRQQWLQERRDAGL